MLRTLECSGFKSFDRFRLAFQPGLNILVGPNGSGKTNIVLFLEFLGLLTHSPLIEAIGRVGGAGSIFRRTSDGKLTHEIKFTITGNGNFQDPRTENVDFVSYEYDAVIRLSIEENTVVFQKQRLKMNVTPKEHAVTVEEPLGRSIDVETELSGADIVS
jgi:predicted ATPase